MNCPQYNSTHAYIVPHNSVIVKWFYQFLFENIMPEVQANNMTIISDKTYIIFGFKSARLSFTSCKYIAINKKQNTQYIFQELLIFNLRTSPKKRQWCDRQSPFGCANCTCAPLCEVALTCGKVPCTDLSNTARLLLRWRFSFPCYC